MLCFCFFQTQHNFLQHLLKYMYANFLKYFFLGNELIWGERTTLKEKKQRAKE